MVPVYSLPRDEQQVWQRLSHAPADDPATHEQVSRILHGVQRHGDAAVLDATRKYDGVALDPTDMRVPVEVLEDCWNQLDRDVQKALKLAAKRIKAFHEKQKRASWELRDPAGLRLAQRWMPFRSVGLYVPGGRAAYPSSVLMNALPAMVAGVPRVVAVTPPARTGERNTATLGALWLCGVTEVYQIGGAQAVAALAYGTATIPRVDKVVGPGNRFVAEAKRQLYGTISIDSLAGPSDVLVVADRTAPLEWIAADMLAQAEHDPEAQAVAVLVGRKDGEALRKEIAAQVARAPRREILEQSLATHGAIIHVGTRKAALEVANRRAPEHLELLVEKPREMATEVYCAGSIFLGLHSAEAVGDYIAGPNHVLPTGGTARSFSPLSVQDFLRMTQWVECTAKGLAAVGPSAMVLAKAEQLHAHGESIRVRLESSPPRKGARRG